MAIVTRAAKGSALTYGELDGNFTDLDARTSIGWQSSPGSIDTSGIGNPPTKVAYKGLFQANKFDPTFQQEFTVTFHMPHDYVPGTPIVPHGHILSDTASTGVVRWGFDMTWASGFNANLGGTPTGEQIFSAPATMYIEVNMTAAYQDTQLILEYPTPIYLTGLDSESVFIMRVFRDAAHINDTYPDGVYLLRVGLYYQCQGFGSVNR